MKLSEKQGRFAVDVADLIIYASTLGGVYLTFGDAYQDNAWHEKYSSRFPHLKRGQHPKRLAVDLNLFVDGVYQSGHHPIWDKLGYYWKSLRGGNRWGGDFRNSDFNHFEHFSSL